MISGVVYSVEIYSEKTSPGHLPVQRSQVQGVFLRFRIRRGLCGRNHRPGSDAVIASAHSPSACAFSSSSITWFTYGWG